LSSILLSDTRLTFYDFVPLRLTLERCKKCSTKISNKFCWKFI